jgi:hypothetical protein
VASSFRKGLFRAPFGPAYYRGFADRTDAIAVSINEPLVPRPLVNGSPVAATLDQEPEPIHPGPAAPEETVSEQSPARQDRLLPYLLWASAGALAVTAGVTGALALDARNEWEQEDFQRQSVEAKARYDAYRISFFVCAGGALAATVAGAILYPWGDDDESSATITPDLSPGHVGVTLSLPW